MLRYGNKIYLVPRYKERFPQRGKRMELLEYGDWRTGEGSVLYWAGLPFPPCGEAHFNNFIVSEEKMEVKKVGSQLDMLQVVVTGRCLCVEFSSHPFSMSVSLFSLTQFEVETDSHLSCCHSRHLLSVYAFQEFELKVR